MSQETSQKHRHPHTSLQAVSCQRVHSQRCPQLFTLLSVPCYVFIILVDDPSANTLLPEWSGQSSKQPPERPSRAEPAWLGGSESAQEGEAASTDRNAAKVIQHFSKLCFTNCIQSTVLTARLIQQFRSHQLGHKNAVCLM